MTLAVVGVDVLVSERGSSRRGGCLHDVCKHSSVLVGQARGRWSLRAKKGLFFVGDVCHLDVENGVGFFWNAIAF